MLVGQKRISTALALGLLAAGLTGSARAQAAVKLEGYR